MIYHVTSRAAWEQAQSAGEYRAESLATEGFIHCSELHQVDGVLQRYYQGVTGLVLLHIRASALEAKLIYEIAPSINESFPHIYGPINLGAVEEVAPIPDQRG